MQRYEMVHVQTEGAALLYLKGKIVNVGAGYTPNGVFAIAPN